VAARTHSKTLFTWAHFLRTGGFTRVITLALCAALAFCLVGCGHSANSDLNSAQTAQTAIEASQQTDENPADLPSDGTGADSSSNSNAPANANSASATSPTSPTDSQTPAATGSLKVRFIDVGQGDCVLITCNGQNLLIDGGQPSASSKLYSILKTLNITYLDYVIGTHPDADHIGATSGALSYATCGTFYCSTTKSDTKTFTKLTNKIAEMGLSITVPEVDTSFTLGGATITFIGPTQAFEDDNNNSLVCRLDYGSTSFLFTGDMESESEYALLASGEDVSADVIKVAHHGSNSSSTASFLSAVNPTYAVICVGENTYGHPKSKVLDRLSASGAQILRTDQLGTITFVSDGTTLSQTSTTGYVLD
jgi:competence protein ComEC